MSLEAALREHGGVSPPGSGRSSPVPRAARRTVEDGLYKADKSLKRYAATIERALGSWEISPEEWADYIAFLARLLKAIQTHPKDTPFLPHSRSIATRLAQCLNPALPSGVHQKSLEVYTYIFSTFGNDYNTTHLHEFLPGLSAVLSFASLSVRPGLYDLFENHIVQLSSQDLRPALKSLILGLLPALEEETAEDFERAFKILRALETIFVPDAESIDLTLEPDGFFWQCLFLAVITNPSRRQGALNYLVHRLPNLAPALTNLKEGNAKLQLSRAASCVVSPEPGLLIRCFVCGLSDSQMLIQRGFLDLLVTHMPLHSPVLQHMIGPDDLDRLISAATQVLLRRDMSLNRRLWSWFLGPEPKDQPNGSQTSSPNLERSHSGDSETSAQLRYFSQFGQNSLQRCILKMLQDTSREPSQKARPYRICLSLMDRWEIGGLLVPKVFLPAMRDLYEYSLLARSSDVADVVRSASLFFDGVEASLIWESLLGTLHESLERGQAATSAVDLFDWIIKTFNVNDEEMVTIHIPQAIVYLVTCLNSSSLSPSIRSKVVSTLTRLLDFVPSRALQSTNGPNTMSSTEAQMTDEAVRVAVLKFYRDNNQSSGKSTTPLTGFRIAVVLASRTMRLLCFALEGLDADLFANSTTLFLALSSRSGLSLDDGTELRDAFIKTLERASDSIVPFPILQSIVALEASWPRRKVGVDGHADSPLVRLESQVTTQLWQYLSPERPKHHVEAVKAFWQFYGVISPDDGMISSLLGLLRGVPSDRGYSATRAEMARRFTVLWGHSVSAGNTKPAHGRRSSVMATYQDVKHVARPQEVLEEPLLVTLDALSDPADGAFEVVRSWLQSLPSLEQVFSILFKHLIELAFAIRKQAAGDQRDRTERVRMVDHVLSHFQNMLTHGNQWARRTLSRMQTTVDVNPGGSEGLALLASTCASLLCSDSHTSEMLNRRLISVLDLLLSSQNAAELKPLDLDSTLLERLVVCISGELENLQGGILRLVQLALKLRLVPILPEAPVDTRQRGSVSSKRPSMAPSLRPNASASSLSLVPSPPHQLFRTLRIGFSSTRTRYYLDQWLAFLADILPTFADALFTNLLSLVECLCEQVANVQQELEQMSCRHNSSNAVASESAAMSLLEALEMVLDRAYECLLSENVPEPTPKESEARPNFLTNVASGVFKAEGPPSRTSKSNSRLTVILALQDSIRVALRMWLWASNPAHTSNFDTTSAATTGYIALRLRNKTRHLLEQIFSVEPLEGLEVVIAHWSNADTDREAVTALSLLHVMQVSRPKNVVPATLDALCSRTNPSAISAARNSSLTIDLSPSDVATFFSAYLDSTEDDAIDELWPDCVAFLRDVLANPLPYRQILPHFLSIILLLAEKLNNTNFGEQRKMRRDLGDIFQRLLTATFTTLPSGYVSDFAVDGVSQNGSTRTRHASLEHTLALVPVLRRVTFKLDLILETQERMAYAINNITQSLLSPIMKSKSFPKNIGQDVLALVVQMTRKAPGTKQWKKEIADAFNDQRLLSSSPELMSLGWFPVLHQWSLHDKERMPELLSRLTPPSSAGIMFGVGASAARLEADRRTQLNLRRLCLLLLASPEDTYVAHLRLIEEKMSELFEASPSSSPSAAIRAELFMLCRTLSLSVSNVHMSPFWPIINDKLEAALTSLLPGNEKGDDFNNLSILQACKLLDLLVSLSPDEFQLHEWLYITDTIDAVYHPPDFTPVALSDQIAETLGTTSIDDNIMATTPTTSGSGGSVKRRPLLGDDQVVDKNDIKALPKEEFVRVVIRPFLSQLSMHAYEGVYSLEQADGKKLREGLLNDLLDSGSIVE